LFAKSWKNQKKNVNEKLKANGWSDELLIVFVEEIICRVGVGGGC